MKIAGGALVAALVADLWADQAPHLFRYRPPESPPPRSVHLAGTFNGWSTSATPMTDEDGDGVWEVAVPLPPGEHQYKFVVNGSDWRPDPANPRTAPDGYGGVNSVVRSEDAPAPPAAPVRGDGRIHAASIAHRRDARYAVRPAPGRAVIVLRLARDDVEAVEAVVAGAARPMARVAADGRFEWWRTEIAAPAETFAYHFAVRDGGRAYVIDRNGLGETVSRRFEIDPPLFRTPRWAREAIFYQIFPERFANGDTSNDPPGTRPWRYEPLPRGPEGWNAYYGGDLEGVAAHVDYLRALGVTAVYLNPIFEAESNHKYNTSDYYAVDAHLGGETAFAKMRSALADAGIRIVLDGVFNHSGEAHPFFRDVAARGRESPYWDWYTIYRWPFPARFEAEGENRPSRFYACWAGFGGLPEWRTTHPDVRSHIFGAVEKWTPAIDGWRLDVAGEVEHDFWRDFRPLVRRIRPEAYILGEIWEHGGPWLGGDQFDATMNYPLRGAILDFLIADRIDAATFADRVASLLVDLPLPAVEVQYNMLSSHDVERLATLAGGRTARVRQAVAFQFAFPGAPAIYYGEEIGMEGGGDPDNRRVFPWDDPPRSSRDLFEFYRRAIALRKERPALRAAGLVPLLAEGRTFVGAKVGAEPLLVVLHASDAPAANVAVELPSGWPDGAWVDLLAGGRAEARGGRLVLHLGPRAAAWLVPVE